MIRCNIKKYADEFPRYCWPVNFLKTNGSSRLDLFCIKAGLVKLENSTFVSESTVYSLKGKPATCNLN